MGLHGVLDNAGLKWTHARAGQVRSGRALLTAGVLGLLNACGGHPPGSQMESPGGRSDTPTSHAAMPPIYVDSDVEFLLLGRNSMRASYLENLDVCQQAGLPLSPLSDDQVERLGKGRLQRWFIDDTFAYRWEHWHFASAAGTQEGMCQFVFGSKGTHQVFSPGHHEAIDLETGERFSQPAKHAGFYARAPLPEEDVVGVPPGREREAAGVVCRQKTHVPHEGCAWSGGGQWGFTARDPFLEPSNVGHMKHTIVLAQEPVGDNGTRVTTRSFIVGADFERRQMTPRGAL